jgi:hypothetical protein
VAWFRQKVTVDSVLSLVMFAALCCAIGCRIHFPIPSVGLWDVVVVYQKTAFPLKEAFGNGLRDWCQASIHDKVYEEVSRDLGGVDNKKDMVDQDYLRAHGKMRDNPLDRLMLQVSTYDGSAFPVGLEAPGKIDLWGLVFPVIVVTLGVQIYRCFPSYPAEGPDIVRWVEYMVTSPLQVVLVALSFDIRETATLWCLGAMQTILVVTGYSIEREIDSNREWNREWNHEGKSMKVYGSLAGLVLLYSVSVLLHVVIWAVISARWFEEKNVAQCSYPAS